LAVCFFAVAAFTSSAAAQTTRCPNPIAIVRAGATAAPASAVAGALLDPTCTNIDKIDRATKENIEQALKTTGAQPGIVVVAASRFTGALMSRLDGAHEQTAISLGGDGPMGLGAKSKSRSQPIAPSSPVSVYAMGTFAGGHRSDTPDSVGLSYEATAGTVGMEYRVTRSLIVGLAGNIITASADLHGGADVDIDAVQLATYLSCATKLWFVDALLSYGRYDLDMARPGVNSLVQGNTGGDVFALAVRGGYLFDLGGVRAGPIAGLSFARTRVDGYTETGDQQVALHVASQTVDAVTGSVGVRFLAPFLAEGKVVIPYLNITLEQQLGGDAHALNVSLAQAGTEPILVAAPNFDTRTYGKIEGGITLHLGQSVSATVSGASTFARDEGNDYRLSTGFTYKF
jgi:uncharacterized protein YhjY with autotransporter beta-barrel domain